jgi:hypothetical protein
MGTISDMATPNEVRGVRVAAYFWVRSIVFLLGLGAVTWGGLYLPLFWQQSSLEHMTSEVLLGHAFKMELLLDETRKAEATERSSFCNPTTLRDVAILRLAVLDKAIAASDRTLIDSAYSRLNDDARSALSCSPADPFIWLTLFWLDAAKRGLGPDGARYLRLSYALGPNEGWIALRRNRLAMAVFAQLPADLANDAIDEFVKLVDTGRLYPEAAAVFAGAAPAVQSRIVERLKTANAISRQIFARALYDKGLDVNIPDTVIPGLRSWER